MILDLTLAGVGLGIVAFFLILWLAKSLMTAAGWHSGKCDCPKSGHISGCQGWAAVCVPPDALAGERRRLLAGLPEPQRFGEGG